MLNRGGTMSIIQAMSRAGWMLMEVIVAVLIFPPVASAASRVHDGVIGTSGHKADGSPTSQLLTAEAGPSFYHKEDQLPVEDDIGLHQYKGDSFGALKAPATKSNCRQQGSPPCT